MACSEESKQAIRLGSIYMPIGHKLLTAAIEEALKLFSRSRSEGLDGRSNAKLTIADYRERLDYIV